MQSHAQQRGLPLWCLSPAEASRTAMAASSRKHMDPRRRAAPDRDRYLPCAEPEGGPEGIGSPRGPPLRGPPLSRRLVWCGETSGPYQAIWAAGAVLDRLSGSWSDIANRSGVGKSSMGKTCDGIIAIFRLVRTCDRPGFHSGLICNESVAPGRADGTRGYGAPLRLLRQRLHFCECSHVWSVVVHARAPPAMYATK